MKKLGRVLDHWDGTRRIMFCDETAAGARRSLRGLSGPWAVLIGPEGGFSPGERARLQRSEAAYSVSLGPRILRADTAAVAALTVWQQALGDWA